jgi:hypothetical protein
MAKAPANTLALTLTIRPPLACQPVGTCSVMTSATHHHRPVTWPTPATLSESASALSGSGTTGSRATRSLKAKQCGEKVQPRPPSNRERTGGGVPAPLKPPPAKIHGARGRHARYFPRVSFLGQNHYKRHRSDVAGSARTDHAGRELCPADAGRRIGAERRLNCVPESSGTIVPERRASPRCCLGIRRSCVEHSLDTICAPRGGIVSHPARVR